MAPRPGSREGSINTQPRLSRQNSASTAHTNIFSDEYALDASASMGGITPVDSLHDSLDITLEPRENLSDAHTRTTPRSAVPTPLANLRASSSAPRNLSQANSAFLPHRPNQSLALSDASTTRSLSVSSRISMPRAHSPYNGPTAPSHPYAMYPQVTRASSIASASTVRPMERPFVAQGGPEHPYAMYQNNVPEDDDEPSSSVPLTLPAMASSFQESRSSGNDTGDIVGRDGHVETLPPYTRYADNVLDKGDMADIDRTRSAVIAVDDTPTEASTDPSTTPLTPRGAEAFEDAQARKEGWRTRAKRRKCCGIPCWIVVGVVTVILGATAVGGIIGGVIGTKQGVEKAEAASSATTVWLDADPVSTGAAVPPCPTGHYTMSLGQTNQIEQCILDINFQAGGFWDCMDYATLGLSIFDEGPDYPPMAVFDDYSLRPQLFRYGPQPPDFNQTKFDLEPVFDKDDSEYGIAMFFSTLFDKIVILTEDQISPNMVDKRSVSHGELPRRGQSFGYLAVDDNPWYCFWNSTVEEFWIFLEKEPDGSSATTASAQAMSTITSSPSSGSHIAVNAPYTPEVPPAVATTTLTTTVDGDYDDDSYPTSAPSGWDGPKRRSWPAQGDSPTFPKFVKMVEKRKPHSNVAPYCQQMEVKSDWQILPKPGVPTVCIEETEYSIPTPTGDTKRWVNNRLPRKRSDSVDELESMCICEWMSS